MKASMKSSLVGYKESYDAYMVGVQAENIDFATVNFGRKKWDSNSGKWVLIDGEKAITDVIKNMDEFYEYRIVIQQGVLCYCCMEYLGESIDDDISKCAAELGYNVIVVSKDGKDGFIYNGEESKFASFSGVDLDGNTVSYSMYTPDTTGFRAKTSYYAIFQSDTNINQIDISHAISEKYGSPDGWYNYLDKKWANILTNNNGVMTYWVWVPRFAYDSNSGVLNSSIDWNEVSLDSETGAPNFSFDPEVNIEFVDVNNKDKDGNSLSSNYVVPDAFTFDGKALTGFWMSKYQVQEATDINSGFQVIASLDTVSVLVSDLTDEASYSVWIDDESKGTMPLNDPTNPCKKTDLEEGSTHSVVILDSSGYRKWTFNVTTLKKQPPQEVYANISFDLSKFDKNNTYLVLYEAYTTSNGKPSAKNPLLLPISELDSSKMQTGSDILNYINSKSVGSNYYWYNYGNLGTAGNGSGETDKTKPMIWANIATASNGELAFWTYIPRYAVLQVGGSSSSSFDVRYIGTGVTNENISKDETVTNVGVDISNYYVPDAFSFGGVPLAGYWMSKYEVQGFEMHPDYTGSISQTRIDTNNDNEIDSIKASIKIVPAIQSGELFPQEYYTISVKEKGKSLELNSNYGTYSDTKRTDDVTLAPDTTYVVSVYSKLNSKKLNQSDSDILIMGWQEEITTQGLTSVGLNNIKIDLGALGTNSNSNINLVFYDATGTNVLGTKLLSDAKELSWNDEAKWTTVTEGTVTSDVFESSNGVGSYTENGVTYYWFDYSNKIWANISVSRKVDEIKDGVATGSNIDHVSEWVYIPRYEYKTNDLGGTLINFIAKSTTIPSSPEFTIPDAFSFDGKALNGYWMSKREVGYKK